MANTSEMMRDEEKRADRDDMRLKNTQRMTQDLQHYVVNNIQ